MNFPLPREIAAPVAVPRLPAKPRDPVSRRPVKRYVALAALVACLGYAALSVSLTALLVAGGVLVAAAAALAAVAVSAQNHSLPY